MSAPGTFLLTFDVELLWGLFFHRAWRERALRRHGGIREVFREILAALARHEVRATFAFVGHLFLPRCERVGGRAHPEMPRPDHDRFPGDWYDFDPATDLERDPLWYGPDLVAMVREAGPAHEIGAHGFSHAPHDAGREVARAEMAAAARAGRELGLALASYVFPRNVVAHAADLASAGFTCFRAGGDRGRRAGSFPGRLLGRAPPVGRPRRVGDLVEVPTSHPVLPAIGLRRLVPAASRLREVRRGLERARDLGACYHLWTHPHSFVEGREAMLAYLDGVLALVSEFRARGEIEVRTMAEVAP